MAEGTKRVLILIPVMIGGLFLPLFLMADSMYENGMVVNNLTLYAHENVMFPIYVAFLGAILSICLNVTLRTSQT